MDAMLHCDAIHDATLRSFHFVFEHPLFARFSNRARMSQNAKAK
jgi:hypothetical protein